jgi:hypothetical protein
VYFVASYAVDRFPYMFSLRELCNSGACVLLDGEVVTPVGPQEGVRPAPDGKDTQNIGLLTLAVRAAHENAACITARQAQLP